MNKLDKLRMVEMKVVIIQEQLKLWKDVTELVEETSDLVWEIVVEEYKRLKSKELLNSKK